jgi:hypothetical protein
MRGTWQGPAPKIRPLLTWLLNHFRPPPVAGKQLLRVVRSKMEANVVLSSTSLIQACRVGISRADEVLRDQVRDQLASYSTELGDSCQEVLRVLPVLRRPPARRPRGPETIRPRARFPERVLLLSAER